MKTEFIPDRTNAEAQRTQRSAEKIIYSFLRVSPRPPRLCVSPVLAVLLLCVFALIPFGGHAATTNLTALLQQGLFEEQANRNLDAAIAAYSSLATQFDKDRQLAATAVFRLGECYRAQGKTNEAAAQYQRILRDFSDQQTLATLSRQNLAGMGATKTEAAAAENSDAQLLKKLEGKSLTELEKILPTLVPDAALDDLLQKRNEAQSKRVLLAVDLGDKHPDVIRVDALLAELTRQIQEKINGMMQGLKLRAEISPSSSVSKKVAQANPSGFGHYSEDDEITRIQTLLQNSPDLINAPYQGASSPLNKAAENGWLTVATFLIEHGADVNGGNPSALNTAATSGNRAMVELLLSRGADVNAKGSMGKTPLHMAVEKKFSAVVEVLLANKADPNTQDNVGHTPLGAAAASKQLKIVQSLLAAGANPNLENKDGRTPFSFAVESGSPEIVKNFLATKADANGGKLDVPLLAAIHRKDVMTAELLLQAGANAIGKGKVDWNVTINNARYEGGSPDITPLWLAVSENQLPLVQLLLKYKADPNDSQTDGRAVTFSAISNPNIPQPAILEALLDAGAKADARNQSVAFNNVNLDQPLLNRAVEIKNAASVETLLKHGANVNAADGYGNTPFHMAAANLVERNIFELLLAYKADPNVRTSDGKTPLDLLMKKTGQASRADRFGTRTIQNVSPELKDLAGQLADLLRQHGALDNLPNWDCIAVSRPAANFSAEIFRKSTNDWNQFTLLELIYRSYGNDNGRQLSFPDLTRVTVARPGANGATAKRIEINLLNATNSVDCAKDMPLVFGDVVEIPERGHTLAEDDNWFATEWQKLLAHFQERAGEVRLAVAGGRVVQLPLKDFAVANGYLGSVLKSPAARNVLTSGSDLSRVKVARRDLKTKKTNEWILDCSQMNGVPVLYNAPDLLLRDGDVIEVPEKP